MNILINNKEFLKYIEIWNKIESFFNEEVNRPVHNKLIKTKTSAYSDAFKDNKNLKKGEYYGHSILLIESICDGRKQTLSSNILRNFFFEKNISVPSENCMNLTINKSK